MFDESFVESNSRDGPVPFGGGAGYSADCDSQTRPNCNECDLFKINRSQLGNPGVAVGNEARFLLQA